MRVLLVLTVFFVYSHGCAPEPGTTEETIESAEIGGEVNPPITDTASARKKREAFVVIREKRQVTGTESTGSTTPEGTTPESSSTSSDTTTEVSTQGTSGTTSNGGSSSATTNSGTTLATSSGSAGTTMSGSGTTTKSSGTTSQSGTPAGGSGTTESQSGTTTHSHPHEPYGGQETNPETARENLLSDIRDALNRVLIENSIGSDSVDISNLTLDPPLSVFVVNDCSTLSDADKKIAFEARGRNIGPSCDPAQRGKIFTSKLSLRATSNSGPVVKSKWLQMMYLLQDKLENEGFIFIEDLYLK